MIRFLLILAMSIISSQSHAATGESVEIPMNITDFKKFRDPFKAPEFQVAQDERGALEKFSVNEFKLVAVMTGPVRMRAMIADPTGKTHTVAKSASIGLREGKVIKITTQSVVVREKIVNPLGEAENIDTEIGFASKP
jgi:Tfp pilus assembly protein PilP